MKNSLKKISMSVIAGTIILGSISNVGATSSSPKYFYRTYKTFSFKNLSKLNIENCKNGATVGTPNKKPSKPNWGNIIVTKPNNNNNKPSNNNDTTKEENKQEENTQKPSVEDNKKPDTENTQKPDIDNSQKPNTDNTQKPDTDNQKPSVDNGVSSIESEVLRLVNIERTKEGLSPLKMSSKLSDVARKKSQDMADKNYFSHTSPTYGSPFDMMKQFGISYTAAGENIAKGYPSAEAVMKGWMNSPGHKANILSTKFGTLGVGYVNKGGTTYWTQMFTN